MGGMTPRKLRLGLRPVDLTLVVVDTIGSPQRALPLAGRTLDEAIAWVAETLGGSAPGIPPYQIPDHVVGHGGAFRGNDTGALAALARWYASADALLRELVSCSRTQRSTRRPCAAGPITSTSPLW